MKDLGSLDLPLMQSGNRHWHRFQVVLSLSNSPSGHIGGGKSEAYLDLCQTKDCVASLVKSVDG